MARVPMVSPTGWFPTFHRDGVKGEGKVNWKDRWNGIMTDNDRRSTGQVLARIWIGSLRVRLSLS